MRLVSPSAACRPPRGEALFQPLWVGDLEAAEASLTFESERAFIARPRGVRSIELGGARRLM
jgi:hypothetical protein